MTRQPAWLHPACARTISPTKRWWCMQEEITTQILRLWRRWPTHCLWCCRLTMTTRQPAICGREREIREIRQQKPAPTKGRTAQVASGIQSCFSCALHMHQPTIPAGQDNGLISNLQYMYEHPGEGDNHNANAFASCYRRMADLIPELLRRRMQPKNHARLFGQFALGF